MAGDAKGMRGKGRGVLGSIRKLTDSSWIRKFKDMGLGRKFTVTIVLCLILPLVVVFSLMNSVIAKKFLEKQYEKELEILKQSKPSLENLLEDVVMLSRNVVGDKDVQRLLEEYVRQENVSEESLRKVKLTIEQSVYMKKYISSVSLFSGDKCLYQYGNYYGSEDILEDPQKQAELEGLEGRPMWDPARVLGNYVAGKENGAVVSVYRIINHLYRLVPVGAERISISEEYLCSLYSSVEVAEGEEAYIFDGTGNIVSSREKERLGSTAGVEVREKAVLNNGYYVEKGRGHAVFYYKIPLTGWTIVRTKNMTALKEQISRINTIIWMALVLSVLFGIIFTMLQKRTVINPVVRLAKDVEKVDEGRYYIKLHTRNQDEIGILNQNVISMTRRIQDLIESVYKGQIHMREAEILSLQSQINPHFLYNTLDTMRWIAIEHREDVLAKQIEALSGMFRHVLNNGNEVTTVKEEVVHLKNYLEVQKCRFGEKITVDVNVDESLYPCRVLKLILQPIVENAFVHGLEGKVGGGHIYVSVTGDGDDICYLVRDDGIGVEQEKIQAILDGVGPSGKIYALKNVNDRIRLKYGKGYGMSINSELGRGTAVEVRIARWMEEERHEGIDR